MDQKLNYRNYFSEVGILNSLFEENNMIEALSTIDDFIEIFEEIHKKNGYRKIREGVFIGENVTIDESARIEGKAIIGHNASLGHGAYLRSGVILLDDVHVGHAVEIKHSIVLSKSALAHLNYIGDSIVGRDVNISGGVVLANWRFDKRDVEIKFEDETIKTNLEKFGSILGDECFIGVNSVLNPGTVLQKKSIVFPLVSVKGAHVQTEIFKN